MSPRLPTILTAAAALLLSACMEASELAMLNGAEDGVPEEYLRVDVFPSDRNAELLPESHWVDGWWYDGDSFEIDMHSPVLLEGSVSAAQAISGPSADDPTRAVAVDASVSAWVDGSIMAGSTATDPVSGSYALSLPPAEGWALAVVPSGASSMPFSVFTDLDLAFDHPDWDLMLDNGAKVRGQVQGPDGEPMADLLVRAVHSPTGVEGPYVRTRADGRYTLHLEPDAYRIEIGGDEGSGVPTTSIEIEAEDEQIEQLDLQLGALDTVRASGRVVNATSNRPVAGVAVRFWSRGLVDHPNAELEIETTTDQTGAYEADLLPGQWRLELVAPAELGLGPMADTIYVSPDEQTMAAVLVPMEPYITVQAVVRDPGGEPAAGVTVVATEQDISGRTFTATTDTAGGFTMDVPRSALHLVLTPGDAGTAVTHLDVEGAAFPRGLELSLGRLLTGRVVHQGEPVQASIVEVRDAASERLYGSTITDLDGSFEIRIATDEASLPPNDALDEDTGYWDTGLE
jgi:hypothetical protein